MTRKNRLTLLSCGISVLISVQAFADPPETVLHTSGSWFTPGNWNNGAPNSSKIARVPTGLEAVVFDVAEGSQVSEAHSIIIEASGRIEVDGIETLKVYNNSTLNGILCIYEGGTLEIEGDVTFSGTGGLEPETEDTGNLGIVKGTTSSDSLTIASGCTIKGAADIRIDLINNGRVMASSLYQGEHGTMRLTTYPKSGSGVWGAEGAHGELKVEVEVRGTADWELTDHADAKIVVEADNSCLEGDVTVWKGTIDVNQNFKTSGNLSLKSIYGIIDVAATKTAKFGAPIAGACNPE